MERITILEILYSTVKDSLEWAEEYKDIYAAYVDGVMAMAENLLKVVDKDESTFAEKVAEQLSLSMKENFDKIFKTN